MEGAAQPPQADTYLRARVVRGQLEAEVDEGDGRARPRFRRRLRPPAGVGHQETGVLLRGEEHSGSQWDSGLTPLEGKQAHLHPIRGLPQYGPAHTPRRAP